MTYVVTLNPDDFTLLLEVMKKAQKENIIAWDGQDFICERTTVTMRVKE